MNLEPISVVHEDAGQWQLPPGRALRLQSAHHARRVSVAQGCLWLTRTGGGSEREQDVWIAPGQGQTLPPGTEWVVEGRGETRFAVLELPPTH
jgi:hypothetical protein